MSNLQKFNKTLEDFNQEVEQLKDVSGAYKKLQYLLNSYDKVIQKFEENHKSLHVINNSLESQREKVFDSLDKIISLNKENKTDLENSLEKKGDLIRKENKEFYKELESTIKIKLDENKSQIKQLIENERGQIKDIFKIEFAKNKKDIIETIEKGLDKQTLLLVKNQKMIKIAIWVFGSLNLILSGLVIFKLFIS